MSTIERTLNSISYSIVWRCIQNSLGNLTVKVLVKICRGCDKNSMASFGTQFVGLPYARLHNCTNMTKVGAKWWRISHIAVNSTTSDFRKTEQQSANELQWRDWRLPMWCPILTKLHVITTENHVRLVYIIGYLFNNNYQTGYRWQPSFSGRRWPHLELSSWAHRLSFYVAVI